MARKVVVEVRAQYEVEVEESWTREVIEGTIALGFSLVAGPSQVDVPDVRYIREVELSEASN